MSELGRSFDAAQKRWDNLSEDDVYGPEQPTPEQQRILDKWCAPDYEPTEE